jgi:hypothetical protein
MIFVKYLTELMPNSNPSVTVTHIKVPEDYYADWHNFLSRVVTKTKFKIELKKLWRLKRFRRNYLKLQATFVSQPLLLYFYKPPGRKPESRPRLHFKDQKMSIRMTCEVDLHKDKGRNTNWWNIIASWGSRWDYTRTVITASSLVSFSSKF